MYRAAGRSGRGDPSHRQCPQVRQGRRCAGKDDLHYHWRYLIGNGAFICRSHTKMAAEWHTAVKNRLIAYTEQLKEHPAKDIFGKNEDYPLPWGGMQGEIFHPFCLKYHDRLLKDKALMPSFENYR